MIRIGIFGYGNLGRGVEAAILQNPDMTLAAVFTRRDPSTLKIQTEGVPVLHVDDAPSMVDKIDVMVLCGGSATDLPTQTPAIASLFNCVDSFDTHDSSSLSCGRRGGKGKRKARNDLGRLGSRSFLAYARLYGSGSPLR